MKRGFTWFLEELVSALPILKGLPGQRKNKSVVLADYAQDFAGQALNAIIDMLPKLFAVGHNVLTRQSLETLTAACRTASPRLSGEKLAGMLTAICSAERLWQARDTDIQLSALKLIETGYIR